ncbi:hypothetical protein WJX73_003484 [Symbiochloris irregularis]|uniref:Protein kinase domain-containing protein n=1 Tax=Symbiochloris irregularis TaxID=706552 RepID=A0AAW1PD96_9CHLO
MKTVSIWLVAWLLLALVPAITQAQSSDGTVLLQLKDAVTNWNDFSHENGIEGWTNTASVCSWTGVTCNPAGTHVTAVVLPCNGCKVQAIGGLPGFFANLTSLKTLNLADQLFTGPLPSSWTQMTHLQSLNLSTNRLTGMLPSSWVHGKTFSELQVLALGNNEITGVLAPDPDFESLRVLHLQGNSLTGTVPSTWASAGLPNLAELFLSLNNMSGPLPSQWARQGALPSLQLLDLSSNSLTGSLPPAWGSPTAMQQMVSLSLTDNNLSGTMPASWALERAFPLLNQLNLANNTISGGLLASWGNVSAFQNLSALNLANNGITSTLPASWGGNGAFPLLSNLQLSINHITGTLPSSGLQQLQSLRLDWNRLTGGIPSSWVGLSQLQFLALRPGNDFACGGAPAGAHFEMCRLVVLRIQNVSYETLPANFANALVSAIANSVSAANASATQLLGVEDTNMSSSSFPYMGVPTSSAGRRLLSPVGPGAQPLRKGPRRLLQQRLTESSPSVQASVLVVAESGSTISTLTSQLQGAAANGSLLNELNSLSIPATNVSLIDAVPVNQSPGNSSQTRTASAAPSSGQSQSAGATAAEVVAPIVAFLLLVAVGWVSWRYRRPRWLLKHSAIMKGGTEGSSGNTPTKGPAAEQWQGGSSGREEQEASASTALDVARESGRRESTHEWDPQVLWDLAQQTSSANNAHPRSVSSGHTPVSHSPSTSDSPLLARGTGPGRPHHSSSNLSPQHTAVNLLQSIQSAIEQASVGSSMAVSRDGGAPGSPGRDVAEGTSFQLPALPWSDWEVKESDVAICKRLDGSDWELGGGAFGKVYKAVLGGASTVAVKVLHDAEAAADFGHEIAILRSCRHSNIVQFQGACVRQGRVMLVTEFLTGGDLWHALGKPSVSRPIFSWPVWGHKVALDIARGLHFLHSRTRPIVHFDLKSHNILLASDGTAKIADVGLARILNQEYVSKLDEVAGTFAWAAPELLLGRRCSEKVDIFAFGVVLWEIATGERPARGQMREVRVPQELPVEVHDLMQQCQDVDPKLRPSAKQVFEALSAAVGQQ